MSKIISKSPLMGDSKLTRFIIALQKGFARRFHTAGGWQSVKVDVQFAYTCMKRNLKPATILDSMVEV